MTEAWRVSPLRYGLHKHPVLLMLLVNRTITRFATKISKTYELIGRHGSNEDLPIERKYFEHPSFPRSQGTMPPVSMQVSWQPPSPPAKIFSYCFHRSCSELLVVPSSSAAAHRETDACKAPAALAKSPRSAGTVDIDADVAQSHKSRVARKSSCSLASLSVEAISASCCCTKCIHGTVWAYEE